MTIDNFIEELKKIDIILTKKQLEQLDRYYELVIEWNKKINLTGITEKKEFYLKHFYDSLTINKIVDLNKINNLCDVGTGAGFPGIVLKIAFPKLNVVLIDSLNKRISFLNMVIKELDLKEIQALHVRAEEYSRINIEKFDLVTARAVASINVLLEYSIPMIKINGYFIAMKGLAEEELNNMDKALKKLNANFISQDKFFLPYENSRRTLIKIQKKGKTPRIFPRKNTEIKKNPL